MSRIKAYPSSSTITNLINGLASRISTAMEQDNLAVRHNAYTDYCLALIFSATAHRPIWDPIESQDLFDIEQGLMLISDKVSIEELAWRVVALAPIACEQLKYYQEYLPKLCSWVSDKEASKDLQARLRHLINGEPSMPFFFYLDEENPSVVVNISPGGFEKRINELWGLPLYLLRHIAATELTEQSNEARLAQTQLGHSTGIDHEFGITSTESVIERLGRVRLHIEKYMQRLGWKSLRSPLRSSSTTPSVTKKKVISRNYKSIKLASARRAIDRAKKKSLAKEVVQQSIFSVVGSVDKLTTIAELNEIFDRTILVAEEEGVAKNYCIKLIVRYVRITSKGRELIKKSTRNYQSTSEASPFSSKSLVNFKRARETRQNFIDYLAEKSQSKSVLCIEARVAEIVISAALFSAISDQVRLTNLKKALIKSTYQDEELFVDIPLAEDLETVNRWFPDKISSSLIIGLYKNNTHLDNFNDVVFRKEYDRLSSKLNLIKVKKYPFSALISVARSAIIFEVPGHLAGYLTGDVNSVSLPTSQFIRHKYCQPLKLKIVSNKKELLDSHPWLSGINYLDTKDKTGEPKKFLTVLRELFTKSRKIQYEGGKKRSALQKELLLAEIKLKFTIEEANNWSPLSLSLISWVMHLIENGTRSKNNIAFNTIDKYAFLVARKLLMLEPVDNFLSLDAVVYEEMYLNAVETTSDQQKEDLVGRLQEFHAFLVSEFAVDEIDWSDIAVGNYLSFSDANIVSDKEYQLILNQIYDDESLNVRLKYQYICLLILGYRFGLRFGEAYRLRYSDVLVSEDDIFILVRNSIYGETKTKSGVRQIPALEDWTELEVDAFNKVYEYAKDNFELDKQVSLMTVSTTSRQLINKYTAISYLSRTLKKITGDESLRFHHLRHSFATRMYSQFVEKSGSNTSIKNRQCYFTKYPLRALAEMMGHMHEKTTLESYVHRLDSACKNIIKIDEYSNLVSAYSYALNITQANVRQRLVRKNLLSLHNNIPAPFVEFSIGANSERIDNDDKSVNPGLTLFEIDLLLKKYSATKQPIDRLADQLMLDQGASNKVINLAAKSERESGFDYYQSDFINHDKFFNEQHVWVLKEVKSNKSEDVRLSSLLELFNEFLLNLNNDKKNKVKTGLEIWRLTYQRGFNIVTDSDELDSLRECFLILSLEVEIMKVVSSEYNSDDNINDVDTIYRSRHIPNSREKIKSRQRSGFAIQIKPNSLIKTNQTLARLLIVMSIFLELTDSN
tara:strand:+ start:2234 stop:5968 length:3735 start_codon:yes stop_codon:yes gene_type:complete